jgi:hypothetical protein
MKKRSHYLWAFLFAAVMALATVPKARKLTSPDFKVFYVAARHVLVDPENLYRVSPDRYLYPPSAAILLTPFALTEHYAFFQWAWHALLGLTLAALGAASAGALAALLLLSRYLAISFGYGQINLVVIGILALAGFYLRRARAGGAGAAWAVATGFKVYPAVFAPIFLPRGERRGLFVGIGVGAGLLLLPFLVFGPTLALTLYGEFFDALRAKGLPLYSHNQSIQALLLRLLGGQSFYLHAVGDVNWSIAAWPAGLVRAVGYAIGGFGAALSWRKAMREPRSVDTLLSAGAFSVLFLSHIVWKDYLLFLYFPLRELFRRWPLRHSIALGAAFVAIVTFSSMDIVGPALSTRFDAASIHLWAGVLIWLAWIRK